jgi:hypothetical protein
MSSSGISLRLFGYSMSSCDATRHSALDRAISAHGVDKVMARLNEVKVNEYYIEQIENDILYVLAQEQFSVQEEKYVDQASVVGSTENIAIPIPVPIAGGDNAQFTGCMNVIIERLNKATLEKDFFTINLMMESMTSVIKSTL